MAKAIKCGQCGNPAIGEVQGHPLCLRCYKILHDIKAQEQAQLAAMSNFLMEQAQSVIGIPVEPRIRLPEPQPVVYQNNPTQNFIKLDRSVVGSINTGTIATLNNSMNNIQQQHNPELAKALSHFTNEIIKSKLDLEKKQVLIDDISSLTDQLLTPRELQNKTLVTRAMQFIESNISTVQTLIAMWPQICESLQQAFDFLR